MAPSAIKAAGQIVTPEGLKDLDEPVALSTAEVSGVFEEYATATRNALAAGFTGVELNAASGYLPMQFLSSNSGSAIKIAPGMPFNDIHDIDPKETYTELVKAIASKGLAYLHVMRTTIPETFEWLRPLYAGTFLVNGGFTKEFGKAPELEAKKAAEEAATPAREAVPAE